MAPFLNSGSQVKSHRALMDTRFFQRPEHCFLTMVRSKIRIESKFWTLGDKGRDTYIICLASICDTLLFVSLFVAHIYRATFQICLGWTEQPDLCAFITGGTGKVYHSSCSLRKGGCVTSTHKTANMEKKKVFLRSFKSSKM